VRRLLIIGAALALAGCASNEGGRVLRQVRASLAQISIYAADGGEASVRAIPPIAKASHEAIGMVLLADYGQPAAVEEAYDPETLRVAVADLRDAHRGREWLVNVLRNLPYVGPGIQWGTSAWTAIAALIALLTGKKTYDKVKG